MELINITDRVYYLPNEQETDRPVLGYIKGDRYTLTVDSGNSACHVKKFYKALKQQGLKEPDFTAVTHWHWDHTFGMHCTTGKTIAGHLTNARLKEMEKWEWSDEAIKKHVASGHIDVGSAKNIRLEYPNLKEVKVAIADLEFKNKFVINLGGVHCVLKEIIAPHTPDSVLVYIPEEKVIFIGDANCEDFDNGCIYDKQKLALFTSTLESTDFETCVLSHVEPDGKKGMIDYLKEELDKI
jgi:glyoxylase-like metal-dependent hydrolase (beta-lactamase superfamily II)